jgi:hypothetical protein
MMIVIEKTIDDNTGLDCWLIMDSDTHAVLDRAFDEDDARDIADYYGDIRGDALEFDEIEDDYDGQPDWAQEWNDFDPDC